jgi:hypothetical protein
LGVFCDSIILVSRVLDSVFRHPGSSGHFPGAKFPSGDLKRLRERSILDDFRRYTKLRFHAPPFPGEGLIGPDEASPTILPLFENLRTPDPTRIATLRDWVYDRMGTGPPIDVRDGPIRSEEP